MQLNFIKKISMQPLSFLQKTIIIAVIIFFVFVVGIVYIHINQVRGESLVVFFEKVVAQKVDISQKLPELQVQQIAAYQPKRNPFDFVQEIIKNGQNLLMMRGLRAFPSSVLKLVGVISLGSKFWAVIETPDGKVYRAVIGTPIGQSQGYVKKITDTHIDIFEKRQESDGTWIEYVTTLKLQDDAQQKKS